MDIPLFTTTNRRMLIGWNLSYEIRGCCQSITIFVGIPFTRMRTFTMKCIDTHSCSKVLYRKGMRIISVYIYHYIRITTYILCFKPISCPANILVLRKDKIQITMLKRLSIQKVTNE